MNEQELEDLQKANEGFEDNVKALARMLTELIKNEDPQRMAKLAGINAQGRPTSIYQIKKWRTVLNDLDEEKSVKYLMHEISASQMVSLALHMTEFFDVIHDDEDEYTLDDYRQTDADQLVAIVSDNPIKSEGVNLNFLIMVTDHKTAELADRLNWMAKVFTDIYQMPLPFKNAVSALKDLGIIKDVVSIDDAAAAVSANDSPVNFIDDAMSFDEVIRDHRPHQMPAQTRVSYEKYFKGEK